MHRLHPEAKENNERVKEVGVGFVKLKTGDNKPICIVFKGLNITFGSLCFVVVSFWYIKF